MKRQEARKRKLAEAGVVYNFDKVGYVSGSTPYATAVGSFSHRKKLKARHDDVDAIYFIITVMASPDKLFSHEWSSFWALNLVPLGLVRQLRSGRPDSCRALRNSTSLW
jgi:hypothetical protein